MANKLILLDTSVLVDYFRKTDKRKSYLSKLASGTKYEFAISVITEFEILFGSNSGQKDFWENLFSRLIILDLDSQCIHKAVEVQQDLKRKSQMIDIPDLLIASTAIQHNIQLITKNKRHFHRIKQLQVFEEL